LRARISVPILSSASNRACGVLRRHEAKAALAPAIAASAWARSA
jgi:hypothetical protein